MDEYNLVKRSPTIDEYQRLRQAVGWEKVDIAAAKIGLQKSLFSVCAVCKDEVIGCDRVVGDGGLYFYIQDVMVLPAFQRQGIGKRIMDALMNYLSSHAESNAFIGLMSAKGASKFYEQNGFAERPADGPGMYKIWKK